MVLKNKIYLQNYNAVIDTWSETNITFNRWVIRPDWSKLYVGPTGIVQPELKVHLPKGREWSGFRHYQHEVRALMGSAAKDGNRRAIRLFGGHKAGGISALQEAIETGKIGGKDARLRSWKGNWELSAFWVDNTHIKLQGLQKSLNELVVPYVNEHLGGFIGDSIKQNYFTLGRGRWKALRPKTLRQKIRDQRNKPIPEPAFPLHGESYLPGLPKSWRAYTYRYGWGARDKALGPMTSKRGGRFGFVSYRARGYTSRGEWMRRMAQKGVDAKSSFGRRATGPLKVVGGGAGFVRSSQFSGGFLSAGEFNEENRVKFIYPKDRGGGEATLYSPLRRTPLMDITATLAPYCYVSSGAHTLADGMRIVKRATKGNQYMKTDQISLTGALEPYIYRAPEVFLHEFGVGNQPARPFITEGIARGMNTGVRLIRKNANKITEQAYEDERRLKPRTRAKVQEIFQKMRVFEAEQRKIVEASEVGGKGGDRYLPGYTTGSFDPLIDRNVAAKRERQKSLLTQLMGHYKIWWVLPPTKYWHYIGALADIRGILTGSFFNLGALTAYVKALTLGLVGARMGSPIAFTPKARRRKFRKGLYTRAGYHRK